MTGKNAGVFVRAHKTWYRETWPWQSLFLLLVLGRSCTLMGGLLYYTVPPCFNIVGLKAAVHAFLRSPQ